MRKLTPKLLAVVIGLIVLVTVAILAFVYVSENQQIEQNGLSQAEMLNRMVFEVLYATMRQGGDWAAIREATQRLSELGTFDELRVVWGDTMVQQFGAQPAGLPQDELDRQALGGTEVREIQWEDDHRVVRYVTPVRMQVECLRCHQGQVDEIGSAISTKISLHQYEEANNRRRDTLILVMGGALLVLGLFTFYALQRLVIRPLQTIQQGASAIAAGALDHRLRLPAGDELGMLAEEFNHMAARLQESHAGLEQQVAERTHELERRSSYLEASAEIGRATTSILETGQLLDQVVESIREHFGLFYVGLFLIDESERWAVLQTSASEADRPMLAQGYRLAVGSDSAVGWCIAHAQTRVALHIGAETIRLDDSLLSKTRSEIALPLVSRGRVIGALDAQSTGETTFDEVNTSVLQIVAGQVAVAIDNARLFADTRVALETTRRAYGEFASQVWLELLHTHADWGYRYAHGAVTPTKGDWRPEMRRAMQVVQTVQGDAATEPVLAIPLKMRGQVIGVMGCRKGTAGETWTSEEVTLLETLVDQLGVALEGARLYRDTQRSAVRDRLTGEIAARMRETLDVDTVLQTAVREMGRTLGIARVEVRLGRRTTSPEPAANGATPIQKLEKPE